MSAPAGDAPAPVPGLVSVVVPTYGHRDLVGETLASLRAQAYPRVEVIVVNDGSPDDTAAVLRPLAAAGHIRYVEQANTGQGGARNHGLRLARGEFVAFVDDDDLLLPHALARGVAALRAEPAAVLAYAGYEELRAGGEVRTVRPEPYPSGDVLAAFRLRNWLVSPGQAVMRTASVRAVGGFDTGIWGSDDWDLYVRLARTGHFHYLGGVALRYRLHAQNASRRALLHVRNHLKVVRRHIGWDLPLLVAHQREASRYFVPNLLRFIDDARRAGRPADALRAHLYALAFRPSLLRERSFRRSLVASTLRVPPRMRAAE